MGMLKPEDLPFEETAEERRERALRSKSKPRGVNTEDSYNDGMTYTEADRIADKCGYPSV